MKKSRHSIQVWLIAAILVFLSARGFYWVVRDTSLALASQHWSQTQGEILQSRIEVSYGEKGMRQWSAAVRYRFEAGGQTWEGDTLEFPARRGSKEQATRTISRYPQGAKVPVYYDPKQPSRNCLLRGHVSYFFIVMISLVSLILGAIGIYLPYYSLWVWPRQQASENR